MLPIIKSKALHNLEEDTYENSHKYICIYILYIFHILFRLNCVYCQIF